MKPSALKPYDINFIWFKGNRLGIWDRNMYMSYQYRFMVLPEEDSKPFEVLLI